MNIFPIIKLTIKSAIRSHIFQLLLAVLTIISVSLPNLITGDGTVLGFIQISLQYNLYAIIFILILSTIWLSSFIITKDMEEYQLHMLVTKPISRVTIWFGKCIGIFSLNFILLIISLGITYFMVLWKFNNSEYIGTKEDIKLEKQKIIEEVLISRKVFYPKMKDVKSQALAEFKKKSSIKGSGITNMSIYEKNELIKKYTQDFIAKSAVVNYRQTRKWEFENFPKKVLGDIKLRYKFFVKRVDLTDVSDQRTTNGVLAFHIEREDKGRIENDWKGKRLKNVMGAVFQEDILPPESIKKNQSIEISFTNLDPKKVPLFFIPKDGPKLLIKVGAFWDNYLRAGLVLSIQLLIATLISCSFASFLSMPTAIFTSSVYFLTSVFIPKLVSNSSVPIDSVSSIITWCLEQCVIWTTIPMNYFDVATSLANGEIIEMSFIFIILFKVFLLRTIPIMTIGVFIYKRRELGLVIRK